MVDGVLWRLKIYFTEKYKLSITFKLMLSYIFIYAKMEKCPVATGVTFFVCREWVCRTHFHKLDGRAECICIHVYRVNGQT
jgi:hypothetical protein